MLGSLSATWIILLVTNQFITMCTNHSIKCDGVIERYIACYQEVTFDVAIKTFEKAPNIKSRRFKRNLSSSTNNVTEYYFRFSAFDRTFKGTLFPGIGIIEPKTRVRIFGSTETKELPISVFKESVLEGNLDDDTNSMVHGILKEDRFDGVIHTNNESYFIEPAERFIQTSSSVKHSIVYRERDLVYLAEHDKDEVDAANNTKLCGQSAFKFISKDQAVKERQNEFSKFKRTDYMVNKHIQGSQLSSERNRRSDPVETEEALSCQVLVMADHLFFQYIGLGNIANTIAEMIWHIREADVRFRATDFNSNGVGDNVGFTITGIYIHTSPNNLNYKMADETTSVYKYLDAFSEYDFDDYCLAMAFTYRDFDKGVLGLAFVASSNVYGSLGGICQKRVYFSPENKQYNFNTALVSFINHGNRVPRSVTAIVTTHEFGHNFGSPHDKVNDGACSPGGINGNYLMYPYVSDGSKPNHNSFSQCSKDRIAPTINSKGGCFSTYIGPLCGNNIIEEGEECDCGLISQCAIHDHCCTPPGGDGIDGECTFRRSHGYECSPTANPCCDDTCHIVGAHPVKICSGATECRHPSVCDGVNEDCPPQIHLSNWTLCEHGSKMCNMGSCSKSVCSIHNLEPCQCVSPHRLCAVCCNDAFLNICVPSTYFNITDDYGNEILQRSGQSCNDFTGFCNQVAECITSDSENVLQRLVKMFSEDVRLDIEEWFKTYFLYVIIGVVSVIFVGLLFRACRKRRDSVDAIAYKTGKVAALWNQATDELEQLKLKMEMLERLSQQREEEVVNGTHELVVAIARLALLFDSVPKATLLRIARSSPNEDFAVKQLLIQGFPMKRLQ